MTERENIYQMYQENGWEAGFWVRRENWSNTVALVKLVGSKEAGELVGKPPYFSVPGKGSPKVICDVFDEMTGERIDRDSQLSCPGTYAYQKVIPPAWIETDPMKILAKVGKRPVKVRNGFCGMCDSSFFLEWCLDGETSRSAYELRHLVDVGKLTKGEYAILVGALETNLV